MRFVRRFGETVFLDTRDLIRLIERDEPLPIRDLRKILTRRRARVVLAFSNVMELVPHNERQPPDRGRVKSIMRDLASLPNISIRSTEIERLEFQAAVAAFEDGFARGQAQVALGLGAGVAAVAGQAAGGEEGAHLLLEEVVAGRLGGGRRGGMDLSQQVDLLLFNPSALRFNLKDQDLLRSAITDDRDRLGAKRGARASLAASIKSIFIRHHWAEPTGGLESFIDFVLASPAMCPGWWVSHGVYENFAAISLAFRPRMTSVITLTSLSCRMSHTRR